MFELITADPAKASEFSRDLEGVPVQQWTQLSGGVCAQAYVGPDWHWIVWPNVATFRFRPDGRVVEALPERGASLATVEDLYARYVLPIAMQAVGAEAIHASAVSSVEGVLAFCGERGAGKSTVAYAMSRRGYTHRADDVLALDVTEGAVTVLALPFEPRLRPASAEFFGADTGRRQVRALSPTEQPHRERLAALFVLEGRPGSASPEVSRLTGTDAILSALQHAHCFNPEDAENRRRHFSNYLEIAARIPVISVRYSYGLDRLEELLDCLLRSIGTPHPNALTVC
jgi:hypothetical protein